MTQEGVSAQPAPAGGGRAAMAGAALFASELVACGLIGDGRVLEATARFARMLGLRPDGEERLLDHVAEEYRSQVESALRVQPGDGVLALTCRMRPSDGGDFSAELKVQAVRHGEDRFVLAVVVDLTSQIEIQERLRKAANYDLLTGLPNRVLFHDRISSVLALAAREKRVAGLLVIDLDGFKAVNDVHGHAAGDAVLREIGARFASCARKSDTLARIGGDEFVALLPEIRNREDAGVFAARIVNSLRTPVALPEGPVSLGASVGIAIYPDDGGDMASLFAQADMAMYASKQGGKNRFGYADASAALVLNVLPKGWSEEFRLGVFAMDEEHERLFGLTRELHHLFGAGAGQEQVRAKFQDLLSFARHHFRSEEKLMQAAEFGGYESHRAEHRRLLASLEELSGHSHLAGAAITVRVLQDWLVQHIRTYDRAAAAGILAAHSKFCQTLVA